MANYKSFRDLRVYQMALNSAVEIAALTQSFPKEERFRLTDQISRSSQSVCANIAEAWRKRRYRAEFIAKVSDAETEACETQVWLDLAQRLGYINSAICTEHDERYNRIIGQLVRMIQTADRWVIPSHVIRDTNHTQ